VEGAGTHVRLVEELAFSQTWLSRTWIVSPPTAMMRLMKSRDSSAGYLKTMTSPRSGREARQVPVRERDLEP